MLPALLPLETLPSWPAVPDPSVLQILTVTVFIPFGISAVIAALVMGRHWAARDE
jgi:hypothetical protein